MTIIALCCVIAVVIVYMCCMAAGRSDKLERDMNSNKE